MPKEEKKPKPGDIVNYTKEIDYGVVDENENRIPTKSIAETKILSLLVENNLMLKELTKK